MKQNPLQIPKQPARTTWVQFITQVLAFIGLWQVISGGFTILNRWF